MIEINSQREVAYSLRRLLSQYFGLEHVEHVHSRSLGRARLVSQHQDSIIWDLEWPPILGVLRFQNRIVQRFIPPAQIHAQFITGLLRGTEVNICFNETARGTVVQEHYTVPMANWSWLRAILQEAWLRRLDRIWEEDLKVNVCHGGWPGVPRVETSKPQ